MRTRQSGGGDVIRRGVPVEAPAAAPGSEHAQDAPRDAEKERRSDVSATSLMLQIMTSLSMAVFARQIVPFVMGGKIARGMTPEQVRTRSIDDESVV